MNEKFQTCTPETYPLAMATFNIPCSFPTDPVHIFLFTEVLNAIELKSKLSSGDTDYLYAFVDGELVPSQPGTRLMLTVIVGLK